MVNTTVHQYPAVGACLQCNQLFLVTTPDTRCLTCGGMPSALLPMLPFLRAPLAAPEEPSLPAGMSPITVHVALDCPNCGQSFVVLTTDAHIFVIPPPTPPPAEEAAPVPGSTTEAAPPPDETPPTPSMDRDFYGNPIPGQLVASAADEPEDQPA